MGDTVKVRPNHYEVLGLTPAATLDEIRQAFARQLHLIPVRPFGWLAEISVAHETLRDPAKRKAYDASLAPRPEPPRVPIARPIMSQIRVAATQEPAMRPVAGALFRASDVPPRSQPEPNRQPSVPPPVMNTKPPTLSPRPEELVRAAIAAPPVEQPEEPVSTGNWKVPAIAAAALALAVLFGAWAGIEAGNDNEPVEAERVRTVTVPPSKSVPEVEVAAADPLIAEPPPQPRAPVRAVRPLADRARVPLQIELPDQPVEPAQSDPAPAFEAAAEQPSEIATTASATIPLPHAVIARTIRRIGYACGKVASTSPMEGAAGTFKVTCASGHSYRAAPVRGRYHFRRLG